MALMPKTQREQILVFVALIAVIAMGAYWHFIFKGKSVELAEKNARLEAVVSVNQKARTELARGNVNQLRAQLAGYRENLELIRTLVPTSNEVPSLLDQVSSAARREGLEIAGVDPQPVVEGEQYDTYRYDIGVVGGYHALAAFLANVGSLQRIVAPVNLKLIQPTNPSAIQLKKKKNKNYAPIEARFQIQTFVARKAATDDDAPMSLTDSGAR
ncbi:MAG: type 4a pilus biogenesis protein PilO [Anaerolineae bacterium]|nr:type 4a pilus biogenesis protein PilO [Gemmatimonadaceae bacterium]